jgi:hypothetical protein
MGKLGRKIPLGIVRASDLGPTARCLRLRPLTLAPVRLLRPRSFALATKLNAIGCSSSVDRGPDRVWHESFLELLPYAKVWSVHLTPGMNAAWEQSLRGRDSSLRIRV